MKTLYGFSVLATWREFNELHEGHSSALRAAHPLTREPKTILDWEGSEEGTEVAKFGDLSYAIGSWDFGSNNAGFLNLQVLVKDRNTAKTLAQKLQNAMDD